MAGQKVEVVGVMGGYLIEMVARLWRLVEGSYDHTDVGNGSDH